LTHQGVGILEIVLPVRSDGLLATNVPHVKLETLVEQRFDVETLQTPVISLGLDKAHSHRLTGTVSSQGGRVRCVPVWA
jgi:hypothetical protein